MGCRQDVEAKHMNFSIIISHYDIIRMSSVWTECVTDSSVFLSEAQILHSFSPNVLQIARVFFQKLKFCTVSESFFG